MSGAVQIEAEADPTPLVLSLTKTLRDSAAVPELRDLLTGQNGSVALKSVMDGQTATLTFADGGVRVDHGVAPGVEPIALLPEPEYTLDPAGDPVAEAAAALLCPPLPTWREAAESFWAANQGTPGFLKGLKVVCATEEQEVTFGDASAAYEVHGPAEVLASLLTGRGMSFLFAVAMGAVAVVGSIAELSVMCGAHWKVRFGA